MKIFLSFTSVLMSLTLSQNTYANNIDSIKTAKLKQREIVLIKNEIESSLKQKAILVPKELNGTLNGSISGEINGKMESRKNLSSMLGLGLIGAIAGAAISPIGTLPFLFDTSALMLSGAKIGGAIGVGVGALFPGKEVVGEIKGHIKGSIQGESWDNLYDGRAWAAFVVNPDKLDNVQNNDDCFSSYAAMLSDFKKSGKFYTTSEAKQLVDSVGKMSDLIQSLELDSIELKSEDQIAVGQFLKAQKEWLNKKISFLSVGINAKLERKIIYQVNVNSTYTIRPTRQHFFGMGEHTYTIPLIEVEKVNEKNVNAGAVIKSIAKSLQTDIDQKIKLNNYDPKTVHVELNTPVEGKSSGYQTNYKFKSAAYNFKNNLEKSISVLDGKIQVLPEYISNTNIFTDNDTFLVGVNYLRKGYSPNSMLTVPESRKSCTNKNNLKEFLTETSVENIINFNSINNNSSNTFN